MTELAAYYTCKRGVRELSLGEISDALRRQLPCYMVPAYFEKLSSIPMTSNNKADRKSLPAPKGKRFAQSSAKFVAPRTDTERTLASGLAHVMKIERASVDDHFFHDLGAHSLLMARFGAEIRKRLNISTVSMQDIYLNPTIEKLARHIDALPPEAAGEFARRSRASQSIFLRTSLITAAVHCSSPGGPPGARLAFGFSSSQSSGPMPRCRTSARPICVSWGWQPDLRCSPASSQLR